MDKIHLLALHTYTPQPLRCTSFWVKVDIPKGYSSERYLFQKVYLFLFRTVIIPKSFIHYSEKFYPEGSLFRILE